MGSKRLQSKCLEEMPLRNCLLSKCKTALYVTLSFWLVLANVLIEMQLS